VVVDSVAWVAAEAPVPEEVMEALKGPQPKRIEVVPKSTSLAATETELAASGKAPRKLKAAVKAVGPCQLFDRHVFIRVLSPRFLTSTQCRIWYGRYDFEVSSSNQNCPFRKPHRPTRRKSDRVAILE
jgi:hypothetical protein